MFTTEEIETRKVPGQKLSEPQLRLQKRLYGEEHAAGKGP